MARQAKNREQLSQQLTQRITHNFNEKSPDEMKVHDCLVMDEFLRKNPDIKVDISKHQRMNEALESQKVRKTLIKIESIFVGTSGYNWELPTTPHPLSIFPFNSEFHNAELHYRFVTLQQSLTNVLHGLSSKPGEN